jgi:hypothetical protein
MWASSSLALGEDVVKVNGAVERKASIWVDINPVTLVVTWSVQYGNLYVSV